MECKENWLNRNLISIATQIRLDIIYLYDEHCDIEYVGFIDDTRRILYRRLDYSELISHYMLRNCKYALNYSKIKSYIDNIYLYIENIYIEINMYIQKNKNIKRFNPDFNKEELFESFINKNEIYKEYLDIFNDKTLELLEVNLGNLDIISICNYIKSYSGSILYSIKTIESILNDYRQICILILYWIYKIKNPLDEEYNELNNVINNYIKDIVELISNIVKENKKEKEEEILCGDNLIDIKNRGNAGINCFNESCLLRKKETERNDGIDNHTVYSVPEDIKYIYDKKLKTKELIKPIRLPKLAFVIDINEKESFLFKLDEYNKLYVMNIGNLCPLEGRVCYGNYNYNNLDLNNNNLDLSNHYDVYLNTKFNFSYTDLVIDIEEENNWGKRFDGTTFSFNQKEVAELHIIKNNKRDPIIGILLDDQYDNLYLIYKNETGELYKGETIPRYFN